MVNRKFIFFIKVGLQIYMEKLLAGEVYCRTLQYFNEEETENLRHDKYDGAAHITQIRNIEVLTEDGKTLLGTGDSGQLYHHHPGYQGNIFCLYGIETKTLNLKTETIKPFDLNMDGLNFGDYAVLIFDPGEFIERVKKEVEIQGFPFQYCPVSYYDDTKYQGRLSPFFKSQKFILQNEIRFWIPNTLNKDLAFNIGDISDIAKLLPKSDIEKLGYSPA